MIVLAADTCSNVATAALISETTLLAHTFVNNKKTHSQNMLPQIDQMLKNADINISEIDVFAAAVGPGSFTGVRIGVAAIKGFAQALDKPCISVSTLHALANNVPHFNGIIAPILDARREQVYNAIFEAKDGNITRKTCDRALPLSELLTELKNQPQNVLFLGDGLPVFKYTIQDELNTQAQFAPLHLYMNTASSVAEIALKEATMNNFISYRDLIPEYVRLSQAEQQNI